MASKKRAPTSQAKHAQSAPDAGQSGQDLVHLSRSAGHVQSGGAMSQGSAADFGSAYGNSWLQGAVGDSDAGPVHRKGSGAVASDAGSAFGKATSGGGSEVPYRQEMESAFGQDFSGVSAHTGRSAEMGSIGAEAAAQGESVAFASKSPDKKTVAHELTHVVQSREGRADDGGHSGPHLMSGVSAVNSPAEREAEAVSSRVAGGMSAGNISAGNDGSVHRVLPAAFVAGLKALGTALVSETAVAAATVAGTVVGAAGLAAGNKPGSNGASPHTFGEGAITDRDKLNIEQWLVFETVNQYIQREWGDQLARARAAENGTQVDPDDDCTLPEGERPMVCADDTDTSTDTSSPADNFTLPDSIRGATITAIQNSLKATIEEGFGANKAKQSGSANFVWSDSGSHSADFWGTVGRVKFFDHENTYFSGTKALSENATYLGISLAGAGSFTSIKYLGGKFADDGTSVGETLFFDNDSLKIWVSSVNQRSYSGNHVQVNVETSWEWDDNTTVGWFNINTATSGPTVVNESWSGTPDD